MTKYKFDWINNNLEIQPTSVFWTFAGFDIRGAGTLTLQITLKVDENNSFSVSLSTEGQANDRSDEAIEILMNALLAPYVVE